MQTFTEYRRHENLPEAKLSLVWQDFALPEQPVAIISASGGENDDKENTRLNRELAASVRQAGYGFVWVVGMWIENKGEPTGQPVADVSLIVRGPRCPAGAATQQEEVNAKMRSVFTAQAKKHNQNAFVFKPAVASADDLQILFVDREGLVVDHGTDLRIDEIATNYGRLRSGGNAGRTFGFGAAYYPQSWAGAMLAAALRKKAGGL